MVSLVWGDTFNDTSCQQACAPTNQTSVAPTPFPTPSPTVEGQVGDLVLVGVVSDDPDALTLVALNTLTEGAAYHVTDRGWRGTTDGFTTVR